MIVDTLIESYLNLDGLDSPTERTKVEEKLDTAVHEIQSRHNEIHERFISLKAITETLRNQILNEKELWEKELKKTIELERQLRDRHDIGAGDRVANKLDKDYKRRYEMLKDANYFSSNTNKNVEYDDALKTDYKKTLSEVENKCNMELLKIQHSINILRPLKAMAARWSKKEEQFESGDKINKESSLREESNRVEGQENCTREVTGLQNEGN